MKRSVIQLAGKTQVISLPSKWVKKHGIKKGDALEVSEKRNALICSTSKQVYHNQTKINISGLGPMAKRIIAAIYKAGFEEIEVAYSSAKELSLIQEVLAQTCIGFEIVLNKDNLVTIKNLSTIKEDQYDTLLRRTWLTILEMGSELEKAKDANDYDSIVISDMTINRFTDFCRRVLNTGSYISKTPLPDYVIIETVEKVGDQYVDLAQVLKDAKKSKEITDALKELNKLTRIFYALVYHFSHQDLRIFADRQWAFHLKCDALMKKMNKEQSQAIMMMQSIAKTWFNLNGVLISRDAILKE